MAQANSGWARQPLLAKTAFELAADFTSGAADTRATLAASSCLRELGPLSLQLSGG
jgi:hypothetical protein